MSDAIRATLPAGRPTAVIQRGEALLLLVAIALLSLPTVIGLRSAFWNEENGSQSPIVLLGVLFAVWQAREIFTFDSRETRPVAGLFLFAAGCVFYMLGRVQSFYQLQALSWPLAGLGAALTAGGLPAARRVAVPLIVLLLAIPIPGSIADDLLVPLKLFLSDLVVSVMYHLGLPVAHEGTIISVGYVQLKLADACAGLQSMISLTAICLLGNHLVPPSSRAATAVVTALILPIAFMTNFLRLSLLVVAAHLWGSDVMMRVHDYAAYIEVLLSLAMLGLAHLAAERLFGAHGTSRHAG